MRILSLDVGTKRIGYAFANTSSARIAIPRGMIPVDGNEYAEILKQCRLEKADLLVSGRPRNNSGEATRQTETVENFIAALQQYASDNNLNLPPIKYQDESYTSVQAEANIATQGHQLNRRDRADGLVDAEAAALILQDFLESPKLAEIEQEILNK